MAGAAEGCPLLLTQRHVNAVPRSFDRPVTPHLHQAYGAIACVGLPPLEMHLQNPVRRNLSQLSSELDEVDVEVVRTIWNGRC